MSAPRETGNGVSDVRGSNAGRLYELVAAGASKAGERPAKVVLSELFAVPQEPGSVLRGLALWIGLVDATRRELRAVLGPEYAEADFGPALHSVEEFLGRITLKGRWKGPLTALTATVIADLKHAALQVERAGLEGRRTPEEDLQKLIEAIDAAIDEATEADLPQTFKVVLLELLESAKFACLNYRISGIQGLERALDRWVGASRAHPLDFQRCARSVPHFLKAAEILGNLVQAATGVMGLLEPGVGADQLPQ